MMILAFALLILANRHSGAEILTTNLNEIPEGDPIDLFTEKTNEEKEETLIEGLLIDESVGVDRLNRIVVNKRVSPLTIDRERVERIVVTEDLSHGIALDRYGVIAADNDRLIAHTDRKLIADTDLDHETHYTDNLLYRSDRVHRDAVRGDNLRNGVAIDRGSEGDRDHGILDRRLTERKDFDNIGLDLGGNDDIDPANLELDDGTGSDYDLGDVGDFAEDGGQEGSGSLPGVGEGAQVYAYNFPSQGVGAGIGSAGVGAAAGYAGIGAGIGQAVLEGKTVPTLGGVGTYSSIEIVPPGSGSDKDGDGLSAETEAELGTDPTKSDSDGDGYSDGAEISSRTNPKNSLSNPGIPGSVSSPNLGGVGGLANGAGAGGAAGLVTGMVKKQVGISPGVGGDCEEHGGDCDGNHVHGKREYDLPPDGALHIMMHVDGSGSILNTRKQLEVMKSTLLKEALLPYYGNNEELYNRRVTIVDGNGERTLQFFTEASKKDNVLAVVFQDEAQPAYHLPTFNKKPQDHYSKDLRNLKSGLDGYGGVYRGIMFQVDRGKTFAKSFKEFVESAWQGTGYLENSNLRKYYWQENKRHIENKNGIVFSDEYHAKDSGDPQYYLDLIMNASRKVGLNLQAKGAGLTDGRHNNKTQ